MKRWAYEGDGVACPVLKAAVSDPTGKSSAEVLVRVDTGFSGGLLISLDDYLRLRLQEFEKPRSDYFARTAQGVTVSVRSSRGVLTLDGESSECSIYTTPLLLRALLGREVLNRWKVTLDGPEKELSVELG